jgi:tetratricopeptide (TPR) repeat protein
VSPQRWSRVRALFDSALDLPPAEVENYLRVACEGDEDLLGEVRRMLEQHRAAGFLDTPPARPTPAFQRGDVAAGRYRILGPLGRGGMGQVYEAEDTELHERVALKTLLPEIAADSGMIARFKREIQLARKIGHANVCRVFDLARHPADGSSPNPALFLTMEFLEGGTLAQRIDREGRIAPAEALRLIVQMADALDAAHRAGIIHRDFKPGNVMLVPGERGAVVTDFGLARSVGISGDTTATASGQLVGTIDYMAPELFTGSPATPAADQYALALVAYKMVAGTLPFQSDSPLAAVVRRAGQRPPSVREALPELDPAWDHALARALDPDPSRRFATCSQFVDALRGRSQSVTVSLPRLTRRKAAAAIAASLLLLAAPFAWHAWQHARMRPSPEAETLYQQGAADLHAGAYFAATKALGQAVALAPHFTLAHARLAEAWVGLDLTEKATQEMLIARREDLSALSRVERLQVEAIDFTVTRDFPKAVAKYEEILASSDTGSDRYVDLGRACENAGRPDKAMQNYRKAAEGPEHNPAAWLLLGVLYSRSDTPKSEHAFQEAERLYQLSNNLEGLTELALQRGVAAGAHEQFAASAAYLTRALETSRLAGNVHQEVAVKLRMSITAFQAGDAAAAEQYAREALDTARINRIDSLAVRGLNTLGRAYVRKGDLAGAEAYYQQSLTLARNANLGRLTAVNLLSLASLHDGRDRGRAEQEAAEALNFYRGNGYPKEASQCLTIMARTHIAADERGTALDLYRQASEAAGQSHDPLSVALAEESIALVLLDEERYPESLLHFQRDLQLSPTDEMRGYAALNAAQVLWRLGRYTEAADAFGTVEAVAAKFTPLRIRLLRARAGMALSQERFPEAGDLAAAGLALAAPGKDESIRRDLLRIQGVALVATRQTAKGLALCRQALEAVAAGRESDMAEARLGLAQALIQSSNRPAALETLRGHEPDAAHYPESRWRFLAVMTQAAPSDAALAQSALEDLQRMWGENVFRLYLTRPDISRLARPFSRPSNAKTK